MTRPTEHVPAQSAVIASLGAIVGLAVVAAETRRVVADGHAMWPAAAAAIGSFAVVAAVRSLRAPVRRIAAGVAVVTATLVWCAVGVVVAGGSLPGGVLDALAHGVADIVGARWPAPATPATTGLLVALTALAGGLTAELLRRQRFSAAPVPMLAMLGLVAVLAAEAGPPPMSVVLVCGLSSLAMLQGGRTTPHSAFTIAVTAAVVVVATVVPVGLRPVMSSERFDPRDADERPAQSTDEQSPLSRVDEWRSLDDGTVMFSTTLAAPTRWRLVGLTRYDGESWQPAADYRISSSHVVEPDDGAPVVDAEVTIGALDSRWVPHLDRTVRVEQVVRVDGTDSGLLPEQPPVAGAVFGLGLQPTRVLPAQLAGARFSSRRDEPLAGIIVPPGAQQLASRIVAGAESDFERAGAIATYLREQYALDPETPPGHSLAVLDLFIETTRRGSDEQFVASYALLAAAAGLPVRIAVGFDTVADGQGGTVAESQRAIAWPEVDFDGFGWVAFDPVPPVIDGASPNVGDGAVAAISDAVVEPPPTTAAPATQSTQPPDAETQADLAGGSGSLPRGVVVTLYGTGALVVLVMIYVVTVLAWKHRRRARRRRTDDPAARAVGAFRSAVDVVVDLGGDARRSATDAQLVESAQRVLGQPARLLTTVADLSTAAVFAPAPPSVAEAEAAWEDVERFERTAAASMGRSRFTRGRLSVRSLRRGLPD